MKEKYYKNNIKIEKSIKMQTCDQCEKYVNLNFCAVCGNKIENYENTIDKLTNMFSSLSKDDWHNILSGIPKDTLKMIESEKSKNNNMFHFNYLKNIKQQIKERIIGMKYLVLKQGWKIAKSGHDILLNLVPTTLEEIREKFDSNLNRFNYCDNVSYAESFVYISDRINDLIKNENILIIDITGLEVREPIEVNDDKMNVYIKNVEIYTKEEFEESTPLLKNIPNWIDYFQCRDIYADFFNYESKISDFKPFIKNKIYIISSCYSKIINEYGEKMNKSKVQGLSEFIINFTKPSVRFL